MCIRFLTGLFFLTLHFNLQADAQESNDHASIWGENVQHYVEEVDYLRTRLQIPGLALAIIEDGEAQYMGALGKNRDDSDFTAATPLRIASVTKSLTAVLVMQAVERGELALSDSVISYVQDFQGASELRISHLLTHTSEGVPGEEYVYGTNRFSLLSRVLQQATGRTYKQLVEERILAPSGMDVYLSPYLGAHAGLVSTAEGLARYAIALDEEILVSNAVQEKMSTPQSSGEGKVLPIGLGWFSQEIQGVQVVWSFGQDDPDHSGALFLRIPEKKLTLAILANANYLSDPFRLLMGDVSKSPFAMSFLRLFVFSEPGNPIPVLTGITKGSEFADEGSTKQLDSYSFEDEIIGHMLVELWDRNREGVDRLWNQWVETYPKRAGDPDIALLFPLVQIGSEPYTSAGLEMAVQLLEEHPYNRWVLLPTAYLFQQTGQDDQAAPLFERILNLPNQEPDFLNRLFRVWSLTGLAEFWMTQDIEKAKELLKEALDLNVGGGTQAGVEALMEQLEEQGTTTN